MQSPGAERRLRQAVRALDQDRIGDFLMWFSVTYV